MLFRCGLGEYEKATEAHNKAIQLDPKSPELWTQKGLTLLIQALYDGMIE
jgi:cytochrome c-type biogenesis protein CcmH/NrfG